MIPIKDTQSLNKQLFFGSLLHIVLIFVALILGYNTYKEFVPLQRIVKNSIQATTPWATLTFFCVYLLFAMSQKTKRIILSSRQYIKILAIYGILLNLGFMKNGKNILIPLYLSIPFFILLLLPLCYSLKKGQTSTSIMDKKCLNVSNPRRQIIFNVILSTVSLLLCLSIGEIYLRYQHHKKIIVKLKDQDLCTTSSTNSDLIYTFKPNMCGTNSQGYVDYEYKYRKDNNVFRIVVIGDSVAQGSGVNLEESFGKMLEKKLNASSKQKKIEVIVLARSGYSTSQELILLKQEAFNYNPNFILWSYVLNDPAHPVYHNANGELGRYFYRPNLQILHFLKSKLFYIIENWTCGTCDQEYHKYLHYIYWDKVQLHIRELGQISKEKKIPVFFIVHPIFEKDKAFSEYSLTSLHKKLTNLASLNGLIPLDLLDEYKFYTANELTLNNSEDKYDRWHPNAKGHEIAAKFIYNRLIDSSFVH